MKIGVRLIAFLTTLMIGVGLHYVTRRALGFRENPFSARESHPRSFSPEDIQAKLRKQVRSRTLANMRVRPEETRGTIAFFYVDSVGNRLAVIDWDVWVDGKHHVLSIDRENYQRSVVEE